MGQVVTGATFVTLRGGSIYCSEGSHVVPARPCGSDRLETK